MSDPYLIEVPELTLLKVCWETCKGGVLWEKVYTVSREEVNMRKEGCIGFILDVLENGLYKFKAFPHVFRADGLLYGSPCTKEDLENWEVTEELLHIHLKRMLSITTLLNSAEVLKRIPEKSMCSFCGVENPDLDPCNLCQRSHCSSHCCGEGEDSEYVGDEPVQGEGWYKH